MVPDRRSLHSSEERPLLEDSPPSYHRTDDVDGVALPTENVPMNNFSRADTIWILAGVWSPVLLGAFDGACERSCVGIAFLRQT